MRDVAAGGESVTIKLARAGAIDGTLAGFSNSPEVFALQNVPGGKLTRMLVDGDRFSRIGLTPGRYTIEAQVGTEVDAQPVEIHPGETAKVTLRDRGAGTVEGTVSDLATHAPIAGLRCDANLLTPGQTIMVPPDVAQQAFTDAAGHFAVSAPIGHVRIFCFVMNGEPRSPAGGDVEVATAGPAKLTAFSVSAMPGPPADAGFMIAPMVLPVTVSDVLPNGPAAAAGLRTGDQVATIDDVSLQGLLPDGAMFLVANHRPGMVVTLGISRDGAVQTIKIRSANRQCDHRCSTLEQRRRTAVHHLTARRSTWVSGRSRHPIRIGSHGVHSNPAHRRRSQTIATDTEVTTCVRTFSHRDHLAAVLPFAPRPSPALRSGENDRRTK